MKVRLIYSRDRQEDPGGKISKIPDVYYDLEMPCPPQNGWRINLPFTGGMPACPMPVLPAGVEEMLRKPDSEGLIVVVCDEEPMYFASAGILGVFVEDAFPGAPDALSTPFYAILLANGWKRAGGATEQ